MRHNVSGTRVQFVVVVSMLSSFFLTAEKLRSKFQRAYVCVNQKAMAISKVLFEALKKLHAVKSLFATSVAYEVHFVTQVNALFGKSNPVYLAPQKQNVYIQNLKPSTRVPEYHIAEITFVVHELLRTFHKKKDDGIFPITEAVLLLQFALGCRFKEAYTFSHFVLQEEDVVPVGETKDIAVKTVCCDVYGLLKSSVEYGEDEEELDHMLAKLKVIQRKKKEDGSNLQDDLENFQTTYPTSWIQAKPVLYLQRDDMKKVLEVRDSIEPKHALQYNRKCNHLLQSLMPDASTRVARKLYALVSYQKYCPVSVSQNAWTAYVLGHTNMETSLYYTNISVKGTTPRVRPTVPDQPLTAQEVARLSVDVLVADKTVSGHHPVGVQDDGINRDVSARGDMALLALLYAMYGHAPRDTLQAQFKLVFGYSVRTSRLDTFYRIVKRLFRETGKSKRP